MGRDERLNLRGLPGGIPIIGAGGGRISTQPPEIWDRFNRPLQAGDVVLLMGGSEQPFLVREIHTVVESGLPDGLMDVTLTCLVKFRAPRAQPNLEFVRVLTAQEAQGAQQPPKDPPPPPPAGDPPSGVVL